MPVVLADRVFHLSDGVQLRDSGPLSFRAIYYRSCPHCVRVHAVYRGSETGNASRNLPWMPEVF